MNYNIQLIDDPYDPSYTEKCDNALPITIKWISLRYIESTIYK